MCLVSFCHFLQCLLLLLCGLVTAGQGSDPAGSASLVPSTNDVLFQKCLEHLAQQIMPHQLSSDWISLWRGWRLGLFSLLGLVPFTVSGEPRSARVLKCSLVSRQLAFKTAVWPCQHLSQPCLPVLFLEAVMFNNSGGARISISYSIFDVPTNRLQTVSFQLAPLLPTKAQQTP